jgi:hypothetical protein
VNKSIVFVHQGINSATYRYRALMPAQEVSKVNGFKATVNTGAGDIIVFSKPVHTDLGLAKAARAEGAKVVVDLSDDHFSHPVIGRLYADICAVADKIVCPTEVMRDRITANLEIEPEVIAEPYEFDELEPHANGEKFLWYGHKGNLIGLMPWKDYIKDLDLTVITDKNDRWPDYIPWSLEAMKSNLASRNIVLLPTMKGAEYKSSNRLVNAIRSGCFAVAQDHPAYREFRKFAWVGNLATGVKWAKHFKNDLNELVKEGQEYIRDRYSPQTIGKQWADLFASM